MKIVLALVALVAVSGCTTMQRVFRPAGTQPVQQGSLPPPPAYSSSSTVATPYATTPYGSPASPYTTSTATPYTPYSTSSTTGYAPSQDLGLLEADRRLGAAAAERGLAGAIVEAADPQASVLTAVGAFRGAEAIQKGLGATSTYGPIYWNPERASASSYGDFGFTQGNYVQVLYGAEAVQGRYQTVWRKDSTGRWRILSNVIVPNARQPAAKKR